jgi:histidine triad (HIT) family protein
MNIPAFTYDENNIFAKILRAEIPCKRIYEDEYALAFHDIQPAAPIHILVISKAAFCSIEHFLAEAGAETIANFFASVQKIAAVSGLANSGYRLVSNHGESAGQSVFHFHVHLLGGEISSHVLMK